ncbi:hypothetical protein LK459_07420 [Gordonia otitidis]|uniref:hypothetical protein n=1 Tax=Gordonia otitidis TaxID=249058 RepID=UPI001D15A1C4|nr:hypothetical protein [Gordonia otitidis]UEA60653.1 hypothetical protein LK459_07420 [Gordonia otitidis]
MGLTDTIHSWSGFGRQECPFTDRLADVVPLGVIDIVLDVYPGKRVLVVAASSSRLYKWAASTAGCEVVARGNSPHSLQTAITQLDRRGEEPYDLVVLDGHGNGDDDSPATFDSGVANGIELGQPVISARGIVLSLCFGGTKKYVDAVTARNPGIEVVGPEKVIYGGSFPAVVKPLIEGVLRGELLHDLVNGVSGWKFMVTPNDPSR